MAYAVAHWLWQCGMVGCLPAVVWHGWLWQWRGMAGCGSVTWHGLPWLVVAVWRGWLWQCGVAWLDVAAWCGMVGVFSMWLGVAGVVADAWRGAWCGGCGLAWLVLHDSWCFDFLAWPHATARWLWHVAWHVVWRFLGRVLPCGVQVIQPRHAARCAVRWAGRAAHSPNT